MSTTGLEIALVGHCGPDSFALQSSVMGFVPGSVVHRLDSLEQLNKMMPQLSLLLVNRVLDGQFANTSGIDLIRELNPESPPAMLISNFPESLQEAVEAGGVMGFGKRGMRSAEAEQALKNALNLG
ncbi:MAG: hypothetical protein P1U42_08425 [Phycisphaerales bacterium]|nr:hypothetical protein [Phycisphaerales bacterium]